MALEYMHVSAFTRIPGGGNSAGVICLPEWPTDEVLSGLARSIDLPVTAVIVETERGVELRWRSRAGSFVKSMCGHGTLAASLAMSLSKPDLRKFIFLTPGGPVEVERTEDDLFRLSLPRWDSTRCAHRWPELEEALGWVPTELLDAGRDVLAVFASEVDVRALHPDMVKLRQLGHRGFIATAPGNSFDCVSRFFCPTFGLGVDEDLATGSAHCAIAPFWAQRLGKSTLHALQASEAEAELVCEVGDTSVTVSAPAVLQSYERVSLQGNAKR